MRPLPWRRIRVSAAAHPLRTDAVLAVALTVVTLAQGWDDPMWRPFDAAASVLVVLSTAPTALRRTAPIAVLSFCLVFWLWYAVLGYDPGANIYGVLLALYTVATVHPWWRVVACTIPVGVIWVYAGLTHGGAGVGTLVAQTVVVPATVWAVADRTRRLAVSNAKLEAAGRELARRAVVDERLRIARELHDVVAHHVSVISVQAGLARYVMRVDPDVADAALGTVLDTGAEALDELRRLLELLRIGEPDDAHGSAEPAPGLASLPELAARMRAAGVPVELSVTGLPRPLPSGVDLCAYRVIQESLTNVLRHAWPAAARVAVEYAETALTVTVTDDGAGAGIPTARASGNGLRGMRERAMLYGGALQAGPRETGGFEVRLTLPLTGATPAAE